MNFFDLIAEDSQQNPFPLSQFKNQVVLVVNVASRCGFTPQYQDLQKLYDIYKDKGFVILGFPCNQFGAQEPGNNQEIQSFCSLNYGVSFPILNKVEVNGENTHPVFKFLKSKAPGLLGTEAIKWNFTKFLIDRTGEVVERYAPQTAPLEIKDKVAQLLG